jgi:hypothetical protein
MNFDWSVSNYKVITFLKIFPMIGDKPIQEWTWDDYDCKKNQTYVSYVSPRNLGLSLGKVHCSLGKLPFHPEEQSCPWEEGI